MLNYFLGITQFSKPVEEQRMIRHITMALAIIALLAFGLTLSGCGDEGSDLASGNRSTLSGTTKDQNSFPLSDVMVSIQGLASPTTMSNGQGDYLLTKVPAGTYTVVFEHAGYQTVTVVLSFAPGADLVHNVQMTPQ
jgi:hypothetical protein